MENIQPTKTKSGSGSKADTSDALMSALQQGNTESDGSLSLSALMTATTQNASQKTWTSAKLEALQSKAGLVAGALAEFQAAGGLVAVKNVKVNDEISYPKIYLVAAGLSIKIHHSADGLEFVIAAPSGSELAGAS